MNAKYILITALILLGLGVASTGAALAHSNHDNHEDKVLLCHMSEDQFIIQSVNANEVKSHEANGDFEYKGPETKDTTWCSNNQPGDLCTNIDGKQTTIPEGMQAKDGVCTLIPTPPVVPVVPVVPPVTVSPIVPGFSGK